GRPGMDRGLQLVQVPVEEVIGLGNDHELARRGQRLHELADGVAVPEHVVLALDEEPRDASVPQEPVVGPVAQREAESQGRPHLRGAGGHAQGHARAERESSGHEGPRWEAPLHFAERGQGVVLLAATVVVVALAAAHAAEVEAEGGEAGLLQRLRGAEDHLEVHDAALQRVRVADHRGRYRLSLRMHEQRLQPSRGAREVEALVPGHARILAQGPPPASREAPLFRDQAPGGAWAAACAAAARARSWAARGGGVPWFASLTTRTAPNARARPTVAWSRARSAPLGASRESASSSRQARSPPSPSW